MNTDKEENAYRPGGGPFSFKEVFIRRFGKKTNCMLGCISKPRSPESAVSLPTATKPQGR